MGGENDQERLQQLAGKPPLCLKLAARSQQGLEAWIPRVQRGEEEEMDEL